MDGMNEQERAIAWLWAIEALASFREVDVSLLHGIHEFIHSLQMFIFYYYQSL